MTQAARTLVLALAAGVVVLEVACGGADGSTTTTATNPPQKQAPSSSPTTTPTSAPTGAPTSDPTPPPTTTASCSGKSAQPLDAEWTIHFGDLDRAYEVHVPASYDSTKPTPLVFNFHGYTSDAAQQDVLSGMNAKADAEGFIAVEPQGYHASWNAGACCGDAVAQGLDDVGLVSAMLDTLENKLCVDAKRVYATGMSNGGFLSHRLACELSDRIAAVAPVAGVMALPACTPKRPVPVMHFHGTADPLVPYDGSASLHFPAVPQTFADWGARDACSGDPVETFSNVDTHCSTYEGCGAGAQVTLCTVEGGGHTWPGGTPVPSLGYTTPWINATDQMWKFFVAHPMP